MKESEIKDLECYLARRAVDFGSVPLEIRAIKKLISDWKIMHEALKLIATQCNNQTVEELETNEIENPDISLNSGMCGFFAQEALKKIGVL